MSAVPSRQCGIGVPLFSLVSTRSWGIGEFADLPAFAEWCAAAGQRYVQVLPLNEISPGETSPYSSMTAMALDPIYIHVPDVIDVAALGGEAALPPDDASLLAGVRASDRVRYGDVRALKLRVLRRGYERFVRDEIATRSPRAQAFESYGRREGWWLDGYALFRAIHAAHEERAWWDWPSSLAYSDPAALRAAGASYAGEQQFRAYLQWIAEEQWQAARRAAGVRVFGDLPFMISGDSPVSPVETIRASGCSPSSATTRSETTTTAAAPSLSGQQLPAVTVPSGRNTGSSPARASAVTPGRGPSSALTVVPSASTSGVMSRDQKPLAIAASARC